VKGAANLSHTAVALKGKRNSIADPAKRGAMIAFIVPWIWWSGRTWRK
jgi:hypothetical protein